MPLLRKRRTPQSTVAGRRRLRERRRNIRLTIAAVSFIAAAMALIGAAHIPALQLAHIDVAGADVVKADEIRGVVENELVGAYGYIIPRSNVAVYPAGDVRRALQAAFPRIRTITLDRTALDTLRVSITEREPVGAWCGESRATSTPEAGSCLFVDADGLLFADAPSFSGDVYRRFYGPLERGVPSPGDGRYVQSDVFNTLRTILNGVSDMDYQPTAVTRPNDVDFHVYVADGWFVKVSRRVRPLETLHALETTLESQAFRSDRRDAESPLRYIDVRFEDRVFYAFD